MEENHTGGTSDQAREERDALIARVLSGAASADEQRRLDEAMAQDAGLRRRFDELQGAYLLTAGCGAVSNAMEKKSPERVFPEHRLAQLLGAVEKEARARRREEPAESGWSAIWAWLAPYRMLTGVAAFLVILLVVAGPLLMPQETEVVVYSEIGGTRGLDELGWLSKAGKVRIVQMRKMDEVRLWLQRLKRGRSKGSLWVNLDSNTIHLTRWLGQSEKTRMEPLADGDAARRAQVARLLDEAKKSP